MVQNAREKIAEGLDFRLTLISGSTEGVVGECSGENAQENACCGVLF